MSVKAAQRERERECESGHESVRAKARENKSVRAGERKRVRRDSIGTAVGSSGGAVAEQWRSGAARKGDARAARARAAKARAQESESAREREGIKAADLQFYFRSRARRRRT